MAQSQPQYNQSGENLDAPYSSLGVDQNKDKGVLSHLKDGLAGQARANFIIKVYVLLTVQLSLTFGMCMLSQFCESYRNFQLQYGWFMVFPVLFMMGCMILAFCVQKVRQPPLDFIVMVIFILSFSYVISYACTQVYIDNPGPTVVIAIGTTVALTLAITIYCFLCRANFLILIGVLIVVVITMLMIGIVALFSFAPILINIYCGLAVLVYGIYIIFITKMIIGGQDGLGFPMDNYYIASLFLYIYIIKMFIMILRIFAKK